MNALQNWCILRENHQSFISESFTNHTHQTKQATELQRRKLLNEFKEILKRKILQNISRS